MERQRHQRWLGSMDASQSQGACIRLKRDTIDHGGGGGLRNDIKPIRLFSIKAE